MRRVICLLLVLAVKIGHGLPQRSDCQSGSSSRNKKCVTTNTSFNRPCSSYFDCKFQPEGCDVSVWFECDGSQCLCELFGFARDDFGDLSVNWEENQKGGQCAVGVGGPCGRDNGLEIKCETGYECIDSQCQKMPQKQSTKGGCGQEQGCEFGSITPPCPDPRGCEFGRFTSGESSEYQGSTKSKPTSRGGGKSCDKRFGSCEHQAERPSKNKARPKPKRMEMGSEETESMMPRNGRGGSSSSIFPPSNFRSRASSSSCGSGDKKGGAESCSNGDDDEDERGSKPETGSQGCGNRGKASQAGCGNGGSGNRKPMGPRPNAPKPCREGNCGGGGGSKKPASNPSSSGCGGSSGSCGGRKPKMTTTPPPSSSGCGGRGSGGGCGRRKTTERADRPSCGGNENAGCGGSGGGGRGGSGGSGGRRPSSQPPKRRPSDKPSTGCRSEGGCGNGGQGGSGSGSGRPKKRPGPTPCQGGSSMGCEAEVPKSKPSCGGKGSSNSGCGGTTTTTPKPTSCKESNSCEGGEAEDDKDEETRCDKFFPKLFTTQCPRGI